MDGKQYLRSDEHPRDLWRLLAAILVFLYIGAMFIMSRSDLHAVFEPPLLLPIMNTLFAGLIPIAVSIIAAMYSDQGKGSSFNIYLPRIINEVITSESVVGAVAHGTERILFVDDEPALVDIGTLMLSSLGYEITGATSSMAALDLFRAEPQRFDLVITDMTLPKMTGIDLSREILQIRPDIPIILCSGIRDSETEAQVASLGIRAYCIKPLTRMDLSRVIRETMDGHENLF